MEETGKRVADVMQAAIDPARHRLARSIFTDEELFELEMKHIFESNWVYVCHESQLPRPHDYITQTIGRQPVIINRRKSGELGGLVNACAHRGAALCRDKKGNRSVFACSFHGWCFNSSGDLVKVRDEENGAYPAEFDKANHSIEAVPRVESYRGFVFASLNADVEPLRQYLGGAAEFIDMIVDQAPDGIELLRGSSSYVYHGNWKLQTENGADGYHVGTVHWNYMAVQLRRHTSQRSDTKVMTPGGTGRRAGGFYGFRNGHVVIWSQRENPGDAPNYGNREQYCKHFGEERVRWMLERSRNLGIYPNLFLMDSMSSQIRTWRPVSVDRTEVTSYCYAPIGEPADSRSRRIRQFEDFYNASGLATPDDLAEFRASQLGFGARLAPWNDLSRGATRRLAGDLAAAEFGSMMSGTNIDNEGVFLVQHHAWQQRLREALGERTDG